MSYTGVILYIAPHGRVSKWLDWHLFGLDKGQYEELHTTSMVTFLVFGILHIYYNWKSIMLYMRDKSKKISFTKKEFLIALILNIFFVVGTLTSTQPFKGFLDLGETIKDSWGEKSIEVTSPLDTNTIQVNIKPPPEQLGKKTLQDLSDMGNIDLEKAIKVLKSKGLDDIDSSVRIREISNELDLTTTDIYKLLTE
jgi:hypothetical protein